MRGARSVRSPTRTASGAAKRASPCTSASPDVSATHWPRLSREDCTTFIIRSRTAAKSTPTGPATITPKSAAWRTTQAARALATSVLVGVQPLLTQVPPSSPRSTSAVFQPWPARRTASAGPAWPLPITRAS